MIPSFSGVLFLSLCFSVTLIESYSLWKVISSSIVDRCPHRSEVQSVALAEGEGAVFSI